MSKEYANENQQAQHTAAAHGGAEGSTLTPPGYSNKGQGQGGAGEESDDPLKVPVGQMTFDSEGKDDPSSRHFTRVIHYPPVGDSGVTIGRGYDMGNRTQEEIRNHLIACGFDNSKVSLLVQAQGLKGDAAAQYVRNNKDRVGVITHDQQKKLFQIIYQELKGDMVRITNKKDVVAKYGATDLENLHPAIMELVVDLRFRGDYRSSTRTRVQPLMVKNDLQGMATLMADKSYWMDTFKVPQDRFNRRRDFMKDAAAGNYTQPITDNTTETPTQENAQGPQGSNNTQTEQNQQSSVNTGQTWDHHTNNRIPRIHPSVQPYAFAFINEIQAKLGKTVRVSSGLRSYAEQDEIYKQGRTKPGSKVTWVRGGGSYHNFGLAIDIVEIVNGKANWNGAWQEFANIGKSLGWEWGGDWTSTVDKPHFQMTFGLSTAQLRQMYNANGGNFVSLANAPDQPGPVGEGLNTAPREPAEGAIGTGKVKVSSLNVRSGPSTTNGVVGKLRSGADVDIYQVNGSWIMIGGGQWVHGNYVNQTMAEATSEAESTPQPEPAVENVPAEPAVENTPAADTSPATPTPEAETKPAIPEPETAAPEADGAIGTGIVTPSSLNIRSGPGTKNKVIGKFNGGANVKIYQVEGNWIMVGGGQWVSGNYVNQTMTPAAPTGAGTVTARSGLNVRSGAGVNHNKIDVLKSGADIEIYETNGDWIRIGDGQWVHSKYVEQSETEEVAPEQATVTAGSGLNVRTGPGAENEKIRTLPNGASVDIYTREGDWARIGDGEWVHGRFLSTSPDRDADNDTGGGAEAAPNKEGFDINAAVSHINSNAEPRSIGYCAKYVRQAMEAGGLSTAGRPGSAKGYTTFLPSIGFTEIDTSSYLPGDIVVFDAVPGHVHGHIAMWTGSQWVSDFKQQSMIVASGYRNGTHHIYRWQ